MIIMKTEANKKFYNKPELEIHGDLKKITRFIDFGGTDDDGGQSM